MKKIPKFKPMSVSERIKYELMKLFWKKLMPKGSSIYLGWDNVDMGGQLIKNLGAPVDDNDAARKVDLAAAGGLDVELDGYIWYHTFFDSIDAFMQNPIGAGSISLGEDGVTLDTGVTAGDGAELARRKTNVGSLLVDGSWDKDRLLQVSANINIGEGTEFFIGIGGGNINTVFIDFRFSGGTCYGRCNDGATLTEITLFSYPTDYDITLPHTYEIRFTAGTKIEFYIDGTLLDSITTNLPSGTTDADYLLAAAIYSAATDTALPYTGTLHEALFVQYP